MASVRQRALSKLANSKQLLEQELAVATLAGDSNRIALAHMKMNNLKAKRRRRNKNKKRKSKR